MLIEAHYAGTTYLLKKSDLTWEGGEVMMKTALITLMTLSCQWSWFWHNLGWRWQDFPSLHTNWNCVEWSAKPKENLKGRLWAFDPNASCVCVCVLHAGYFIRALVWFRFNIDHQAQIYILLYQVGHVARRLEGSQAEPLARSFLNQQ